MKFTKDSININPEIETKRIVEFIQNTTQNTLRKKGIVVGLSGGIDSSVVTSLCVKALGKEKVIALMMPDKDSDSKSLDFAFKLIDKLGIDYIIEDITDAVTGFGGYRRRDEAVNRIFPEYNENYKMKIFLPEADTKMKKLNVFYISTIDSNGNQKKARLPFNEYMQIVAASNFKQRCRANLLYYHAEKRNYAVVGTGNKNEHQQGFFVKHGDGAADLKPIAHLFKTQVYQLATYLDIPKEIIERTPTTDTYSAEQTQEEFFFKVPFNVLDRIWFAWENGVEQKEIAVELNLEEDFVSNVINDIQGKIKSTNYLRLDPVTLS
jgi:NAD+ synthase